jgi:hypothetical protein
MMERSSGISIKIESTVFSHVSGIPMSEDCRKKNTTMITISPDQANTWERRLVELCTGFASERT